MDDSLSLRFRAVALGSGRHPLVSLGQGASLSFLSALRAVPLAHGLPKVANSLTSKQNNMKTPLIAWFVTVIVLLAIWDAVWKTIAMWKSARHNQLAWYICLVIFNTAGILPILYILFFQKTEARKIESGVPRPPQFQ